MSGKAVVVYVEEFAEFTEEDFQKVRDAMLRTSSARAALVQTILVPYRSRDTERRCEGAPMEDSGVLLD